MAKIQTTVEMQEVNLLAPVVTNRLVVVLAGGVS